MITITITFRQKKNDYNELFTGSTAEKIVNTLNKPPIDVESTTQ